MSTADLLSKVVIPVADGDVAETTARAAQGYLDDDSEVVLVHVVSENNFESESQWEAFAEDAFDSARSVLGSEGVSTEIRQGEDVVETVFAVADDVDASAVAFRSRGGSRWRRIMAGDVARELVTEARHPVVVLPRPDGVTVGRPAVDGRRPSVRGRSVYPVPGRWAHSLV